MNEFEFYISVYSASIALLVIGPILLRVFRMLRMRPKPKRVTRRRSMPGELAPLRDPQHAVRQPAPPVDVLIK